MNIVKDAFRGKLLYNNNIQGIIIIIINEVELNVKLFHIDCKV